MNRKVTVVILASFLLLATLAQTTPPSYAIEWGPDMRLTSDSSFDWCPSITQTSDGKTWVVWKSDRIANGELYYAVHDGSSWSNDTRLTFDTHTDRFPSIMQAQDGKIWVAWESDRNEQDWNLYYKIFDGSSWSNDTLLTTDPYVDAYPSIMQAADGKIWVAWMSNREVYNEIHQAELFYKVYNGSSWSVDTRFTWDNSSADWDPSIMQAADGKIWVAWTKDAGDIYIKIFNGTLWSPDMRLTFDPEIDSYPSIAQAHDGTVWVVWNSDRDLYDNVYYKFYDGYWHTDTKLTDYMASDIQPSITKAMNGTLWVAWTSTRLGNIDIYHKTSITSEHHDVAIINVTTNATTARRSETVAIEVTVQNQGTQEESFEVQCYANSTQIGSKTIFLAAGRTYTLTPFYWNTSGIAQGIYIINATAAAVPEETDLADNYKPANNPVEITIMGDICGMSDEGLLPIPDGNVNIDDLMTVAMPGHIWTEYPTWDPIWGPVCDVNRDGMVNMGDLLVISIHYGET